MAIPGIFKELLPTVDYIFKVVYSKWGLYSKLV